MGSAENFPRAQDSQNDAEIAPNTPEYLPAPHGWHVLKEEAPKPLEYMPLGQNLHVAFDAAPTLSENVP